MQLRNPSIIDQEAAFYKKKGLPDPIYARSVDSVIAYFSEMKERSTSGFAINAKGNFVDLPGGRPYPVTVRIVFGSGWARFFVILIEKVTRSDYF